MDLKRQSDLRDFIQQRLVMKGDSAALADNEPLFSSGRLDSLDAVETIMFIESEYGIDFAALHFDLTLLDSIAAIIRLADGQPDRGDPR
jgi:acyl carrier protein